MRSRNSVAAGVVGMLAFVALLAPTVNALDVTGGVLNVAPTIVSVTLGSSSLSPTPGSTTSVTTTIVVSDGNGFNDISGVSVEILKPDGTTTHLASSAAAFTSGNSLTATYTKSSSMNYYDAPATGLNSYKVKVTVTDSQSASATNLAALATFSYAASVALNADTSSLALGSSISPGDQGSAQALSIQNYGNSQLDVQVSGTALSHASLDATIPVGSITYGLASDLSDGAALTGSAVTLSAFNLAAGSGSSKNLYWSLTVPSASSQYVPAGTYSGTITLTATSG